MPDLIAVFSRWWKTILLITLLATALALVIALVSPKEYRAITTALPANSVVADRARIFNNNIEGLYSELGSVDELDRIEGTAALDTLFLSAAAAFRLGERYKIKAGNDALYKAAMRLKKNTQVVRSAYGELKIRVLDREPVQAAAMANFLLQQLQEIHQQLKNQSNTAILGRVREDYALKQQQYRQLSDSAAALSRGDAEMAGVRKSVLFEQLQQYEKLIDQYQLALRTNAPVLLVVEPARVPVEPARPNVLQTVLFALAAAFGGSFLLALLLDSRRSA